MGVPQAEAQVKGLKSTQLGWKGLHRCNKIWKKKEVRQRCLHRSNDHVTALLADASQQSYHCTKRVHGVQAHKLMACKSLCC
jgi:hypothetical protein